MPKQLKVVVPLYPLLHTARESLDAALFESGMLLEAVDTYLSIAKPAGKAAERLQERCTKLRATLYGSERDVQAPPVRMVVTGPRFPSRG